MTHRPAPSPRDPFNANRRHVLHSLLTGPVLPLSADTFGNGPNPINIAFVDIGNAGNSADDTGFGAVAYSYPISKHGVSKAMIPAYNAANLGLQITPFNRGPTKPATMVSWNEAARFVNWRNTSHGAFSPFSVAQPAELRQSVRFGLGEEPGFGFAGD